MMWLNLLGLVFLFVTQVSLADHLSDIEKCASSDAKCVGKVILSAVSMLGLGGGGGAKTTYCRCDYNAYSRVYKIGLYRISDGTLIATNIAADTFFDAASCQQALIAHPSCR